MPSCCQCVCIFHLCPGLQAEAKIAIFHVLQKIASLTIFCVTCGFSQLFVMLIITKPDRVADLTKFAKIAKFAILTIFSVTCDFSQFFVMLMFTFLVFMIT